MGTIHGFCASSQASATCARVAFLRSPIRFDQIDQRLVGGHGLRREAGQDGAEIVAAILVSLPMAPVRKPLPSGL